MSYRLSCIALLVGLVASGCSKSSTAPTATPQPKFTATLTQANEFPAITNADGTGSGTVSVQVNGQPASTCTITSGAEGSG